MLIPKPTWAWHLNGMCVARMQNRIHGKDVYVRVSGMLPAIVREDCVRAYGAILGAIARRN